MLKDLYLGFQNLGLELQFHEVRQTYLCLCLPVPDRQAPLALEPSVQDSIAGL
jgi:hypothetical protein